jgi:rod shape-determining protein MreD
MHWITFVILLVIATALQKTIAPFVAVHTIRPDLMVVIAVHYALAARAQDALLACWSVGLAIDLTSLSFSGAPNVGLHALSLGLIGLVIVKLRDLTFRESVATQIFFTLAAKLILSLVTGAYLLYVVRDGTARFGEVVLTGAYAAVYTAVLAPYGHWILRRLRNLLGIGTTHRLRVR